MIGNEHDARRAMLDYGHDTDCTCGCATHDDGLHAAMAYDPDFEPEPSAWTKRIIGRGERRTAYLVNGVVYKIGRNVSCRREHEKFTAWRTAGAAWAPETALYEVTDGYGETWAVTAMTYLPDDDSEVDEAILAEIRRAAPQTCRENYTAYQGATYLIDGEDIEYWPTA